VEAISYIDQIMEWPLILRILVKLGIRSSQIEKTLKAQGIGRHSFLDRTALTVADLRTVSVILGKRNFIGGDQPCEEDCAVFGFLANILWAAPSSPYEKIMESKGKSSSNGRISHKCCTNLSFNTLGSGEYANLKQYCLRMQKLYWPDWDKLTSKYQSK
jgi:hypothetical protein